MKKTFILAILSIMMIAMPSKAQVTFGIRGGYNLTNISGGLSTDNKSGFYVGPTVKFTVPIVGMSIDASALYDQRDASINIKESSGNTYNQSSTAKNINIPINVRYGLGLSSVANIFAFAGPQFGFNLSSDKTFKENASTWTWRSSEFSLNFGIGATVIKNIEIKANYNLALGKTANLNVVDAAGNVIASGKAKYNAWQIGACYWF